MQSAYVLNSVQIMCKICFALTLFCKGQYHYFTFLIIRRQNSTRNFRGPSTKAKRRRFRHTEVTQHASFWLRLVIVSPSGIRSSFIKEILRREFKGRICFHSRPERNYSELVYDVCGGGSYVEAALSSIGIN